jgi:hypothetical protein
MIAESFNPPRELVDEMCSPMVVKVIGPQLSRGFVAGEHMEGTDHDRVGRVDQEHGKIALQNVIERFPVLTGALHGDMRDAAAANQSDKASRSAVIVPNALSSNSPSGCWPVGSGVARQAITVFLCTSNPAQWVNITSMAPLPS